ncbi:MAG: hypothetical protein PHQ40_00605 [Anaerolineaceae bacterium]|jgi:hypothetical protein|nr:hypothetical protein [Anaerolineaceae bacterium]
MNGYEFSVVQALSIAGSTFAVGITLGWILALLHTGGSSGRSNHDDKDD